METLEQGLNEVSMCLSIQVEHLPYRDIQSGIKFFTLRGKDVREIRSVEASSKGINNLVDWLIDCLLKIPISFQETFLQVFKYFMI